MPDQNNATKTFRPYFWKDRYYVRIFGLFSLVFLLPLIPPVSFFIINRFDPTYPSPFSDPISITIGLFIMPLAFVIAIVGSFGLLRSRVILTEKELIVINGFSRKRRIPLHQIEGAAYRVLTKGYVLASPYGGSGKMPYEAGVILCRANGIAELPMGWFYLQDLLKELKDRLGDQLKVDEASFAQWEKWYFRTSFLKKAIQTILAIIAVIIFAAIPILLTWYFVDKVNLFGLKGRFWGEKTESEEWLMGVLVVIGFLIYLGTIVLVAKLSDVFVKTVRRMKRKL